MADRRDEGRNFAEIVAGAWDFERINRRYARHLKVLAERARAARCGSTRRRRRCCAGRRVEVLRDASRQLRTFHRA